MKRILALVLCTAFLLVGCSSAGSSSALPVAANPQPTPTPTPEPTPSPTVRFSASGDNLIHGSIYLQAQRRTSDGSYDFGPLYENVAYFYAEQDLNFINQETLVSDELEPSHYPLFCSPGEVARECYDLGFRLFGTSNNHIDDKGAEGISSTLRFWDSMPEDVLISGLWENDGEDTIPLYEKDGITFALLAYTQYTNGIPTPQGSPAHVILTSETDLIQSQIEQANELADVVLVSVHWGNEDSHAVTDGQRSLAQQMADWGADLIIGTHPHVLQGAEWLDRADGGRSFVAYSLGNFVSAQSRPDELIGAVFGCTFQKNANGETELLDPCFYPTVTHYGAGYSDIKVYFLSDYSTELAQAHGVRSDYPYFNAEYIQQVIAENLPSEYLAQSKAA